MVQMRTRKFAFEINWHLMVKTTVEISQNFVTLSDYMNFTRRCNVKFPTFPNLWFNQSQYSVAVNIAKKKLIVRFTTVRCKRPRECVSTGAAGAQTHKFLGHHLLHPHFGNFSERLIWHFLTHAWKSKFGPKIRGL